MWEKLSYIFTVLMLGLFFAVLMYPLTAKVEAFLGKRQRGRAKHRYFRVLSVLICYLFLLALIGLLFFLFSISLYQYFADISWEEWARKVVTGIQNTVEKMPFFSHPTLKEKGTEFCFSVLTKAMEKILRFFGTILMGLPKMLGKVGLALIISLYLLIDRDNYRNSLSLLAGKEMTKEKRKRIGKVKKLFFGYWKGQSLDALFMGCLISGGLFLLRVPLGIAIGILAGVGNLIPYVGPFLAYGGTIFFCVVEGKGKTLLLALIYLLILQQIDGSYIGPKLIGKQVSLRPLTVVLSVLIGGTLFGILGMMLAVPAAAILKNWLWEEQKNKEKGRKEESLDTKKELL